MKVPAADASDVEGRVGAVLDWLANPACAEIAGELGFTRAKLSEFMALPVSINQFHRVLDLFQARAEALSRAIKRDLREAAQPPSRDLRLFAHHLDGLHGQVCEGYQRVVRDIEHRLVRNRRRDPAAVAARALKALRERLEIAAYVARPAPRELWAQAHRLYRIAHAAPRTEDAAADKVRGACRLYQEMLAFAAAQPEHLSGIEVAATVEYLSHFAPTVVVLDTAPPGADYRLFWVDLQADAAPAAWARKPPAGTDMLYFSCARLGTLAGEHLRELEAGTAPTQLHLPPEADQPAFRGLLQKLHESWSEPATRHLVRRHHSYEVRMAIGLDALGRLFQAGDDARGEPLALSDWTVVNESPSGYALLHTAGEIHGVVTGEAVAIRPDSSKPWEICMVRWVRSEHVEKIEVGLQVLAASARPVRLAFRHARTPQPAMPALWLPAQPALRDHDGVLMAAATAASQRFVMVAEDAGRTSVLQGRILSLDVQTARVTLFQFQDDPYPL